MNTDLNDNHNSDNIDIDHVKIGGGGQSFRAKNHNCPICDSAGLKFVFTNYDDRFGYPNDYRIEQCTCCGHVFVNEKMTPAMLADMYTNYYPRNQISLESFTPFKEKNKIIAWIDGDGAKAHTHIPHNVRVLDIGCGSCEALGYHRNRGCDVYGVDADDNASRIGKKYGLNVKSGMFDPDDYETDFFDFITLNDVLEHVIDPLETLQNARKVLKPSGKIVATLPNVNSVGRLVFRNYWVGWHTPYHLHFFSRKSLQTVAARAELKLHRLHFCTTYQRTLAQIGFIFARSPKGQKTAFTNLYGKFDPANEKKLSVKMYKFLEKTRLLSPVTRLFDTFHIGDSMTAIFEK